MAISDWSASVVIVIIIFSSLLELSDVTDWVDVAASYNKQTKPQIFLQNFIKYKKYNQHAR